MTNQEIAEALDVFCTLKESLTKEEFDGLMEHIQKETANYYSPAEREQKLQELNAELARFAAEELQ